MPRELTARAMNGVGGIRQRLSSHDIPRKLRYALRGRCPACRTERLVEKGVFNVCRKCGLRVEGGPLERARAEIQRRKS